MQFDIAIEVQKYNHEKYWSRRKKIINSNKKTVFNILRMIAVKRSDALHNASMGTDFGSGASFATPPNLPHGLNGIIVSHYAKIGVNCTIYQQVTIAGENGGAASIGDNVTIGAGAKIIGKIKIGSNVKIGANAVVVKDIPDNCTAVGIPARIIQRNE